jgi:hypothetical protein
LLKNIYIYNYIGVVSRCSSAEELGENNLKLKRSHVHSPAFENNPILQTKSQRTNFENQLRYVHQIATSQLVVNQLIMRE